MFTDDINHDYDFKITVSAYIDVYCVLSHFDCLFFLKAPSACNKSVALMASIVWKAMFGKYTEH